MDSIKTEEDVKVYLGLLPQEISDLHDAQIIITSWLFAQKLKGLLIINFYDVTSEEYNNQNEKSIFVNLGWLGINWSEGSLETEKSCDVYKQSSRIGIYKELLEKLIRQNSAYFVVRGKDEKFSARVDSKSPRFDELRKSLKADTSSSSVKTHSQFEVHLNMASIHATTMHDIYNGDAALEIDRSETIVLWQVSGKPTEVFACAVDKYFLNITHSIRMRDEFSNSIHEIFIQQALGGRQVYYVHLPFQTELNRDKSSFQPQLNSIESLRRNGFLPHTLVSLLSQPEIKLNGDEELNIKENYFSSFHIRTIPGLLNNLDKEYLLRLNRYFLKRLDNEKVVNFVIPFLRRMDFNIADKHKLSQTVFLLRNHLATLNEIADEVIALLGEKFVIHDSYARSILRKESAQKVLWSFLREVKTVEQMTRDDFLRIMTIVQKETGIMGKDSWIPVRVVLTGKMNQYDLAIVAEVLGKEQCIQRIHSIVGNYW